MTSPRKQSKAKEPASSHPAPVVGTPAPPVYRVGRKPLKVGDKYLQPGEVVPEAHTWPRVEAWVRSGWLKEG